MTYFKKLFQHFIFDCSGFSLLHKGFSLVAGFSLWWLLLLWSTGCRARGLQQLWLSLPCGMWDLPGPGIEPMSFTLAGGFLTSGPPGKPRPTDILHEVHQGYMVQVSTFKVNSRSPGPHRIWKRHHSFKKLNCQFQKKGRILVLFCWLGRHGHP